MQQVREIEAIIEWSQMHKHDILNIKRVDNQGNKSRIKLIKLIQGIRLIKSNQRIELIKSNQ